MRFRHLTFYKSSFLSHSLISQSVINSCKFNLLTIYAQDEISKNALKTYMSKLFGRGVLYTLLQKNNVSIHPQKGRIYFRFMRVNDNTLHQYCNAILFVLQQKGLELMKSINKKHWCTHQSYGPKKFPREHHCFHKI